eukprot:CAMPEP_0202440492 /NCGR_PEP_ID=MMETSP1345-20130828/36726_1 /ASSEMBLY_ACC=CAM_ASM_000843 /TAXON_ID=342563 /ORGANISM="Fabrea Fabrea salina" /LENGTH=737 /DNA_ID=CAMNT_0049055097 /DNA_START=1 /DNA_END=2214 /DNA_ORIENTATION=+
MNRIRRELIENLFEYLDTGVFNNRSNETYVKAYGTVLELADQEDFSELLYNYYIDTIKNYTIENVKKSLSEQTGETFLSNLVKRWENHKILVYWMRKIFMYLDKYHVKNTQSTPLFQVGLEIFREEIFEGIAGHLRGVIIEQIRKEREGQLIDRNLLKEVLLCFVQVGLTEVSIEKIIEKGDDGKREKIVWKGTKHLERYKDLFETFFLSDTQEYYRSKSAGWISCLSCPEYISKAKKVLEEEEDRAEKYLDHSTMNPLLAIVVEEIVTKHALTLTEMEGTGCLDMFKHKKLDELRNMYLVFKRDEQTLKYMTSKMNPYIEVRGSKIVEDEKLQQDAIEYTKALLEFKSEIDAMVEYSFDNHSVFQRCRDLSFQNFMNKCQFSAPYIASYADHEMRKGLKGVSEAETDQRLEALIKLFLCLNDRDVFIRNYTRYLSKRLLDGTSISDEAEEKMISKLKVECGHNIVNKISSMYQDIALSSNLMEEFKGLSHRGSPGGINMTVQVLRSGCWPEQSSEPCIIPPELETCTKAFQNFYLNKHQGRNLTWLLGFGTVEIGTNFAKRNYTCIVNPYQAAILLLFNSGDSYTLAAIKEATKLSDRTLKAHVLGFFNPKMKILQKSSKGKVLNDEDQITVNSDFHTTSLRVNYVPKKVKKCESNTKEEEQAIQSERKNILDSVIVRIAKSRRVIKHQELVAEVIRQVSHFRPQPTMIKTQIESLIQREFLARDEKDRATYNYIP